MLTKSIRWRLQIWQAFLLFCILTGFGVTAYQLYRTNQINQIDEELTRRIASLSSDSRGRPPIFGPPPNSPFFDNSRSNTMRANSQNRFDLPPPPDHRFDQGRDFIFERPPDGEPPPWHDGPDDFRDFRSRDIRISQQTHNLFNETDTNAFYFCISYGTNILRRSTNAPPNLILPRSSSDTRVHIRDDLNRREAFRSFDKGGICILVGRSITSDLMAIRRFELLMVAIGTGILAIGLGGGWLMASKAILPLKTITSAANRISVGNLSERINIADTDNELGHLAGVLNSTFSRLEASFAQQKQFSADASHELRTPIAVIISEAQTTLARERSAAEYRETIEVCLETAQQMRRLTQSLLELARYDAGQTSMERQSFDLSERVQLCSELIHPLARHRNIHIRQDLSSARMIGDPDRIDQVITNLLSNAIYYNKDGGKIDISTQAEGASVILTISDTGSGISADDISHIFERFYRADKSRSQTEGRNGLGLAICKAIIDAHGGRIEVSSQPNMGTTFRVIVPVG